ncbi:hypothetical protein MAUB1S_00582 [Mycolicibacterium aubagnense]
MLCADTHLSPYVLAGNGFATSYEVVSCALYSRVVILYGAD